MQQQFASSEIKLRIVNTQPIIDKGRRGIVISDPMGISNEMVFVPGSLTLLLPLMDGTRDLAPNGSPEEQEREDMDPVCKMLVHTVDNELTIAARGRKFYFCSRGCTERFLSRREG